MEKICTTGTNGTAILAGLAGAPFGAAPRGVGAGLTGR